MWRTRRSRLILTLGTILGVALPGCSHGNGNERRSEAYAAKRGQFLYEQNCSACHDAENLELLKRPPRLTGLFRKGTLPSGGPATDLEVRNTILNGKGIMPPFRQTLDKDEVEDLLKYLHTLSAEPRGVTK